MKTGTIIALIAAPVAVAGGGFAAWEFWKGRKSSSASSSSSSPAAAPAAPAAAPAAGGGFNLNALVSAAPGLISSASQLVSAF